MRCHTAAREARLQRAHCVRLENEEKTPAYPAPCLHGPLLTRPPTAYSSAHHLLGLPPLTRPPPAFSAVTDLHGPPLAPQYTKSGQPHMLPKKSQSTRDVAEKKKKTCLTQKKPYRVGILAASRVGNPGGRDMWAFRVEERCSYLPTDWPGGDRL